MEYVSNVNWAKLLKNYRDNYNYSDEWEIAVLELIANSIDAKANKIELSFTQTSEGKIDLTCEDNGKGMDENEFKEYHNLGSLSKDKQTKTIGFAGIGAKLCLDLCDEIYTETSNEEKKLATRWFFDKENNVPKYTPIDPENKLKFKTGTFVRINGLKIRNFSLDQVKNLVLENYRYCLKPLGKIELKINGETLIGRKYEGITKIKSEKTLNQSYKTKRGKLNLNGEFFITELEKKRKTKEIVGIDIVVCGKTIVKGETFDLEFNIKPGYQLIGYIRCDELIEIVKTSKDGLNKQTKIWNEFKKVVSKWLEEYLKEEKLWREYTSQKDLETFIILNEIGEELSRILYNFPEFSEILNPVKRKVPILNEDGLLIAKDSQKGQLTTGTIGGLNVGHDETIPTEGMENLTGIEGGKEKKAVEKHKRVRGVKIISEDLSEHKERVIFRPHESLFILNSAHPAYRFSEVFGAIHLYSIFVILEHLVKYGESYGVLKGDAEDYLWRLYEEWLKRYG
ncbi:MAG: ATP-binding protein [Archaeoglobaceae archaeon]